MGASEERDRRVVLRILMKRAWEPDPLVRPAMDSIYKILKREITALRGGDESGLEHTRRRSTFVLNRPSGANPGTRGRSSGGTAPPIRETEPATA